MFANTVQPSLVSLFSSTGSAPLQLFSQHVDPSPALRPDSLIHLLNDATSAPAPPEPGALIEAASINTTYDSDADERDEEDANSNSNKPREGRTLCQTVLHIQSPTLRTTYIRCPPSPHASPPSRTGTGTGTDGELGLGLGLTLPWMHLQVRTLGREWAFEVGVADRAGRKGIVRCSTFQRVSLLLPTETSFFREICYSKEAALTIHHDRPLLHIPLRFPAASSQPDTSWSIISLDLGSTIQQFRAVVVGAAQQPGSRSAAAAHTGNEEDVDEPPYRRTVRGATSTDISTSAPLPSGALGRVMYVKVYANCRLRRIWFSESRRGALPWEFELYASSRK